MCVALDKRFKDHMDESCENEITRLAIQWSEAFPALVKRMVRVVATVDKISLAVAAPAPRGRGRGRGRGRATAKSCPAMKPASKLSKVSDHVKAKVDKKIEKAKNKAEASLKCDGGFASASASSKHALTRLPSDDTAVFSTRTKKIRGLGESAIGSLQWLKEAIEGQLLVYKGAVAKASQQSSDPLEWWQANEGSLSLLALVA